MSGDIRFKSANTYTYGRRFKLSVEVETERDLRKLETLLKKAGAPINRRTYNG